MSERAYQTASQSVAGRVRVLVGVWLSQLVSACVNESDSHGVTDE